jgi:hypothetical protein
VTAADRVIERAAQKLEHAATRAASSGGFAAKLAPELAEDAQFLRKLKPSLVAARLRGEQPTDEPPSTKPARTPPPKSKKKRKGGGPGPIVIAAGGLVVGMLLAKVIDWRSHAHPRK